MFTLVTPLSELRKRKRKTQDQLAAALCITRSAYSKLERGQTELTVERVYRIAQVLGVSIGEILPLPTPDPTQIGVPAAELLFLRAMAEHRVLSYYIDASRDFLEPVPFEELDEHGKYYLEILNFTREDYEAAEGLISRPTLDGDQQAFEQMLRDSDSYSLFQHGIIKETFLLKFWNVFQAKGTPYFEFENKPFGGITKLLLDYEANQEEPLDLSADFPEPPFPVEEEEELQRPVYNPELPIEDFIEKLREYNIRNQAKCQTEYSPEEIKAHIDSLPRVDWTELSLNCDARDMAYCLNEAVFNSPESSFQHLQNNPAEYARTLTRLIGLSWVTEGKIDLLEEESKRLSGAEPSEEFQSFCDEFATRWASSYQ